MNFIPDVRHEVQGSIHTKLLVYEESALGQGFVLLLIQQRELRSTFWSIGSLAPKVVPMTDIESGASVLERVAGVVVFAILRMEARWWSILEERGVDIVLGGA